MTLLFWIGFSIAVGALAAKYGRSSLGWFFLALFISPLLAVIFLLIAGKTLEQQTREAALVQQLAVGSQLLPAPSRPVEHGPRPPARDLIVALAVLAVLGGFLLLGRSGTQAPSPRGPEWNRAQQSMQEPSAAGSRKPETAVVGDRSLRKAGSPAADPTQDALARQLLTMPGVSRW